MNINALKPYKIDLNNDTYIPVQACKQGDTLSMSFEIWNNGILADITGWNCIINASKGNNKTWQIKNATVTANNSTVTISFDSTLTQLSGLLLLELFFYKNDLQKTSFNVEIEVQKSTIASANGNIPPPIITQAEELKKNVIKANDENIKLTDNISKGATLNTSINNTIATGSTLKDNLDSSIESGNKTIEELKETNSAYTEHINNIDIHVSKKDKEYWNHIGKVINLLDKLDIPVTDDNDENVTDDDNNIITM